jgi:cytochrome c oxidase accessory protein FixG
MCDTKMPVKSDPADKPAMAIAGGCGGNCGNCKKPSEQPSAPRATMLDAPEHVLSTLEKDGSRRWLYPSLAIGNHWKRRRIVAYGLIAFFVSLPHLRVGGKPAVLLDIPARNFTILGHVYLPSDTLLLALGMIAVLLSVVLVTTIGGRVWCGWGCPQTVYMEFLFRPIDRFFEGTVGRGGKPQRSYTVAMKLLRVMIYVIASMLLAHTFLAYFVGVERLSMWIRSSPSQHPVAFLVMFGTTAAMLFDFLIFREQLCLIACPYGRFQSVMLDRLSRIIGYDYRRGEPRGKKTHAPAAQDAVTGDCIDCRRCVVVCPTGIDIRDGLQMECINCTQCIDACNEVMRKIGRPEGLIRYTSQAELEGNGGGMLRARTVLYPILLLAVGAAFVAVLSTKHSFDARILRAGGSPFTRSVSGEVQNALRIRLVNRSLQPQSYTITGPLPVGGVVQVVDPTGLQLQPGQTSLVPLLITVPSRLVTGQGSVEASLVIEDQTGKKKTIRYQVLGPKRT